MLFARVIDALCLTARITKALRILALSGFLASLAAPLDGQQLEPGAYSVSPSGVNIFVLTNNLAGGDVNFDPSLPVEDAQAPVNTTIFAYIRSLSIFGRSANLGIGLPIAAGIVQGTYL